MVPGHSDASGELAAIATVPPDASPAQRMRLALDLYEVGEQMVRQRARRERPDATDADLDAAVAAWLRHRPGAEHGDYPGPPSAREV